MSLGEWFLFIFVLVFTLLMMLAAGSYVVRLLRGAKPRRKHRSRSREHDKVKG